MARGNQQTLTNGESGASFRGGLNLMFTDLYGPVMDLQPTKWVDPNRVDSYTADGSIQFPFKSLGGLCSFLSGSTLPGLNIQFTSATTYSESSLVTLPSTVTGPIFINGAGGNIIFNAGFTIPSGLQAPVVMYGLNISIPPGFSFIQGQTSSSYRNLFDGGNLSGAVTINGVLEGRGAVFSGGVITVASTGAFYAGGCSFSSLNNANASPVATSQITSAGALILNGCRVLYSGNQFSIVSTATASPGFAISSTYINNPNSVAGAGCINVSGNSATGALPNFIEDVTAVCGYTAGATINVGSTTTYVGKIYSNTAVTPVWSGTGALPMFDIVSTGGTVDSSLYYNAFKISLVASATTSLTLPTSGYVATGTAGNSLSFVTSGSTNLTLPATSGYVPATGAANQVMNFTTPVGTTTINYANTGTQTALTTSASTFGSSAGAGLNATFTATAATAFYAGFGSTFAFTPVQTTRLMVTIYGQVRNGTIATSTTLTLRYGTGGAPSLNSSAVVGTAIGTQQVYVSSTTAGQFGFSITAIITGLTLTTALWFDLTSVTSTAIASVVTGVGIAIVEV